MFEIVKVVTTFVVGFSVGWGARVALDHHHVNQFKKNAAKVFEAAATEEELREFESVLKKVKGV